MRTVAVVPCRPFLLNPGQHPLHKLALPEWAKLQHQQPEPPPGDGHDPWDVVHSLRVSQVRRAAEAAMTTVPKRPERTSILGSLFLR
jgi:hypothetical protein